MTPAVLALPSALLHLQCHLKSLLLPSSVHIIKAFSSSQALDTEETPAMKALKDIPYPSASPDSLIFESWTDEYDMRLPKAVLARRSIQRLASARSANKRYHPSRVLEQLSIDKKFEEAEQVRQELAERNVPIRTSIVYYSLVWNILRQQPWPPNRTEIFTNWLSLLPIKGSDPRWLDLGRLKSALLFDSRRLDLKTVAQFGIIMSSKGYIQNVGSPVVAFLTRYADPDVSARILDEMLAANDDYSRSNRDTFHKAPTRKDKNTTRHLWSIAVRTHCTAGRPEVALQLVKRAHEHGFRLSKFTYEYLLGKLEADGLDDLAADLRAYPCYGSLDVAKSRLVVVDFSNLTPIPPISRKQSMVVNHAIALAILKRSSRTGLPAYAVDIVPYFDIYKTDLRGGLVENKLRSSAYRISTTAVAAVLLAELLHHHRRGQFRHVLWVFEKFFHVVGVSSEDITRRLWKRKDYPRHLQIHNGKIPLRIKTTTFNLPSRLWPTPYHTALVWSALVHLCESEEELFTLYESLLQHSAQFQKTTVGHHHHHHPSHGNSSSSSSSIIPAPKDRFDAAHFYPFLVAFTQLRDAKYGLRVLDDMQDRGIAPSAEILSMAAALQARHGEPAFALRLLDIIRELIDRDGDGEADVDVEMATGAVSGARAGAKLAAVVWQGVKNEQQLLIAYTGVLRGFIDRRHIVQARRVAELLHSHLGYVEGGGTSDGKGADGEGDGAGAGVGSGNARTDAALRYLRRLEVEGPNAVPESLLTEYAGYFYPFLKKRDPEVRPFPIYFSALLSPWGNPFFFFCYVLFLFPRLRLMVTTAQVIKTLNAAPGSEP